MALQGIDQRRHQLGAARTERVAQRNRAAVDIELFRISSGVLEPRERDAGEGLVDFVKVDIGHAEPGALQSAVGGKQRLFEHDHRIARGHREVVDARQRGQAVGLQRRFGHHQHRRGTIADLARRSRGDRAIGREQLDAGDAFQRRIEADAFVDGVQRCTFGGFDIHADDFLVERARLGRGNRLQVAIISEPVEIVLGEAVLLDDHLGAHELAEVDTRPLRLDPVGLVVEAFLHVQRDVGAHRHAGHAFNTAGDHHVLRSAHHGLGCKLDRLLAGAALAINRHRRGRLREQLARQHAHAANLHRLLARLTDAAGHHIIDGLGIDPAALDEGVERLGQQIHRVHPGQTPAAAAASGADRFDDIRSAHCSLLVFRALAGRAPISCCSPLALGKPPIEA